MTKLRRVTVRTTTRLALGIAATSLALVAVAGQPVRSDSLLIDNIEHSEAAASKMPARGMSMDRVEDVYGSPNRKHNAVGDPPISRWEYNGFVVYFEYRHVIHSVARRAAARAN